MIIITPRFTLDFQWKHGLSWSWRSKHHLYLWCNCDNHHFHADLRFQ